MAFFAFQRFEQGGFFAADIGAVAVGGIEFKGEPAAENVLAEIVGRARLRQRGFKALVAFEDFAVDVVVAGGRAHGVTGDNHAFDQGVGIEEDDVAVFEGAGLAFVGIANDVFGAGEGAGHKAPFETGGKARAAAAAQAGGFDFGDHVVLAQVFGQDFLQRLVAAAFEVSFQRPAFGIAGVHVVENHACLVNSHGACSVCLVCSVRAAFQTACLVFRLLLRPSENRFSYFNHSRVGGNLVWVSTAGRLGSYCCATKIPVCAGGA